MNSELQTYLNGICCSTPAVTYNFDVDSSDWAGVGITDKASFEAALQVSTDQFLLSGDNIKANIVSNNIALGLNEKNITNVNYITISGLESLEIKYGQLVSFNPILPLPTSLKILDLSYNLMTTAGYTASENWANGLHTAPVAGVMFFNVNPESISGTNLQSILISKGWDVLF